jgi:glycosyltransferase involved in cell wall biosynthesis
VSNEQLASLYTAADLYLAPSRHEGFGVPLLEAFRCGCPVVCSTGGALPEVASDAAEVVDSWEPSVWTERIQGLLGDSGKLNELRRRGFEREKEFSWVDSARRLCDLYREVAECSTQNS